MRDVRVRGAEGPFAQDIDVADHRLRADEEIAKGGTGTGPAPHELLLAALGACTAMTLKVYAARKGWAVRDVHVRLNAAPGSAGLVITRDVTLVGDLDAEQRQRLLDIADKCPVHKTLTGEIAIETREVA